MKNKFIFKNFLDLGVEGIGLWNITENSETSLVAEVTKLKLSYFGHLMRKAEFFAKVNHAGKNRKQQKKRKTKQQED